MQGLLGRTGVTVIDTIPTGEKFKSAIAGCWNLLQVGCHGDLWNRKHGSGDNSDCQHRRQGNREQREDRRHRYGERVHR